HVKRNLARPDEVTSIDLLEALLPGFREAEGCARALSPLYIGRVRRCEVEVVAVEADNAQKSRKLCEVAVDHTLEEGHAAESPRFEIGGGEPSDAHHDIHGSDDLPVCEDAGHGAFDARENRVSSIVCHRDLDARRCGAPLAMARARAPCRLLL